ncbi:MAG: phosphatase PAP2 family protein [Flavobacteriaceae bacterium]
MIEELLKYDTDLFLFLNNLGSEPWDLLWQIITNKLTFVPLYAVLLYLVYKNYGLKGMFVIILSAALMITFADQLANLFKYGFQRPRPCQEEDLHSLMRHVVENCGRYGYFSGHAVNSMATAVFMGLILRSKFKYLPFILLFWASIVGYSRIYVGVHYPLDVFTGMAFGSIIGWVFYRIQLILQRRFVKN